MEVISSRSFRAQMGEYMRKSLSSDVIITSRSWGAFKLVPVSEDDTLISKEAFFAKVDAAIKRVEDGKYVEVKSQEGLQVLLDSL